MPITPFLRNEEFDPDTLNAMGSAFTKVCAGLGLSDRADRMTELVALRIIEFAKRGIRNETARYLTVLEQLQLNLNPQ